jgi:hypothetical protein
MYTHRAGHVLATLEGGKQKKQEEEEEERKRNESRIMPLPGLEPEARAPSQARLGQKRKPSTGAAALQLCTNRIF